MNAIILKKKTSKKNFENKIKYLNEKGIQVRPLWKPNHLQKYLKKYQCYKIKQAIKLSNRIVCLPSGSNLKVKNQIKICNLVNEIF